MVNRWLVDANGNLRKEHLPLLAYRARAYALKDDWEAALKDVDEFWSRVDTDQLCRGTSFGVEVCALTALIKGFAFERKGDTTAATKAWQLGYEFGRKHRGHGLLYTAILGSLSNSVTSQDVGAIVDRVASGGLGTSKALPYIQRFTPSDFIASVLRNMWRTPRGRENARKVALDQLPHDQQVTVQVLLTGAEIARRCIQGTDDLKTPLSAEEDELIWTYCKDLFDAYQKGTLDENRVVQLFVTFRGNNGGLGWKGLAPNIEPRLRAPLAYTFGCRYEHLKRPEDAKTFLHTAIDESPSGSALRRLAESKLREIESRDPKK
jgi:hypothetical protein